MSKEVMKDVRMHAFPIIAIVLARAQDTGPILPPEEAPDTGDMGRVRRP